MSTVETHGDAAQTSAAIHDPTHGSFPSSREGRILFWIAVAFSAYQIGVSAHLINFPSQVVRAFHVGFLILLTFPLVASMRGASMPVRTIAWAAGLAGMGVAFYQWIEYAPLILRAGFPLTLDLVVGVVALVTVFAAAWVIMGPALPIISGAFLLYCLFGNYLPGMLAHRGYDFEQVVEHMAYGTEGIYGIPTYV